MKKSYISKTLMKKYMACPLSAWFYKNHYKKKNPDSIDTLELFHQGNVFGEMVREYFRDLYGAENCVLVDRMPWEYDLAMSDTDKALKDGVKVIFEASFAEENGHGFIMADVLINHGNGIFEMIEAKKHSSEDKSKKQAKADVYIQVQTLLKSKHKIELDKISVARVNGGYVRKEGEKKADIARNLIVLDDVTSTVKKYLPKGFYDTKKVLETVTSKEKPERVFTKDCRYCSHSNECLKDKDEYNVLKMLATDWRARAGYLKKENEINLDHLVNIYKRTKSGRGFPHKISESTIIDIESYISKKPYINKVKLKEMLGELKFPLYSLDYETVNSVVPIYP